MHSSWNYCYYTCTLMTMMMTSKIACVIFKTILSFFLHATQLEKMFNFSSSSVQIHSTHPYTKNILCWLLTLMAILVRPSRALKSLIPTPQPFQPVYYIVQLSEIFKLYLTWLPFLLIFIHSSWSISTVQK